MSNAAPLIEAANMLGPHLNGSGPGAKNRVRAISTTTASAISNLSTLLTDVEKGHFLYLQADGAKVYFALNNANSGTIDQAQLDAANVAQQCGFIPSDGTIRIRIVKGFYFLLLKASAGTPAVRVWISSFQDQDQVT